MDFQSISQNIPASMPGMPSKKPRMTLGGALSGMFIGLILILSSPYVLWKAEGQHREKDFLEAMDTKPQESVQGYIKLNAPVTSQNPVTCPSGNCLAYQKDNETLVTSQKEECGQTSQNAKVLYQTRTQTDADGNTEACYMVEVKEWQVQSTENKQADIQLGVYKLVIQGAREEIGWSNQIVTLTPTTREVWNFLPMVSSLTVAGMAQNNVMESGGEKTFVISTLGYEGTLEELRSRDNTSKWLFRGISFAMVLLGFGGLLGLVSYAASILGSIPFLGRFFKEGVNAMVGLITLVCSFVFFLVEWGIILLARNPLYTVFGLIIVGLLVLLGIFIAKSIEKK